MSSGELFLIDADSPEPNVALSIFEQRAPPDLLQLKLARAGCTCGANLDRLGPCELIVL